MLVKRAIIMIAVGALLIVGVAMGKKAVTQTAAGSETGQQQVRPERVDFLAQLREAYDKQDMEAIGNIITQMEQRRDQMQQRREEFREKMQNFDPNDPNCPAGRGMRRPGMRRWNGGPGGPEGFKGGPGCKQVKDGQCPAMGDDPCNLTPEGCPMKHKQGRCGHKPPPPPVDEEIIEQ